MRLLGLDPGLRHTGWGVIDATGNRLVHVADGVVVVRAGQPLAERLSALYRALNAVLDQYAPDEAAVEETFVNKNPASTLKLGVARGVVLLAPAERGLAVHEYSANLIKKSVVGVGHAEKAQVQVMVRRLLPGCLASADAADALAVAICHAHHAATRRKWHAAAKTLSPAGRAQGEGATRHDASLGGKTTAAEKKPSSAERREWDAALSSPAGTLSPAGRGQGEGATRHDASQTAPSPQPSPRRGEGAKTRAAKSKPTLAETERARRLRRDATDVEALLWRRLRDRQLDELKFRRQEPMLGFTVDFVCHERGLVIELDGGQHDEAHARDERRTRLLEEAGFRVLRFWNRDVIDNLDGVVESIRAGALG